MSERETLYPSADQSRPAHFVQDPKTGEWFDPYTDDFGNELDCTHCGGDGECDANANPLWDCDDNPHPCHACGGSGSRRDQRIF